MQKKNSESKTFYEESKLKDCTLMRLNLPANKMSSIGSCADSKSRIRNKQSRPKDSRYHSNQSMIQPNRRSSHGFGIHPVLEKARCSPRVKKRSEWMSEDPLCNYLRQKQDFSLQVKQQFRTEVAALLRTFTQVKDLRSVKEALETTDKNEDSLFSSYLNKLVYYEFAAGLREATQELKLAIRFLRDCQFCSRVYKFDRYTLKVCLQLAELYKQTHDFDSAIEYYQRALELSLMLRDKYSQMKCIDGVGVCYYYRGNSQVANYYHTNIAGLSSLECEMLTENYRIEYRLEREDPLNAHKSRKSSNNNSILASEDCFDVGISKAQESNYDLRNSQSYWNTVSKRSPDPQLFDFQSRSKRYLRLVRQIGQQYRKSPQDEKPKKHFDLEDTTLDNRNQVLVSHAAPARRYNNRKLACLPQRKYKTLLDRLQSLLEAVV